MPMTDGGKMTRKRARATKGKKSALDWINAGMSPDTAIMIGEMPSDEKEISKTLGTLKTNELKTLITNLKAKLKTVERQSFIAADITWRLGEVEKEYTHRISGLNGWIEEMPTPFGGAVDKK
jgi:hypothetical protein